MVILSGDGIDEFKSQTTSALKQRCMDAKIDSSSSDNISDSSSNIPYTQPHSNNKVKQTIDFDSPEKFDKSTASEISKLRKEVKLLSMSIKELSAEKPPLPDQSRYKYH